MPLSTLSINLSPVPIYFLFIFIFSDSQPVLLLPPAPETSQAAELCAGCAGSPRVGGKRQGPGLQNSSRGVH